MNLLSRYDKSKTLSEQATQITPEMQIAYDFYDRASKSFGTNPKLMRDSISRINDANQFWKVNDLVKTNSGGMDIAAVINDELDSNNLFTVQSIVNHLKSKGITSTYAYNGKNFNKNTFKITTVAGKSDLAQAAAAGLPEWTKTFPCLVDRGTMVVSSNPKEVSFTSPKGAVYFFYDDKSFLYIYSDKVTQLKGTFDCVNGTLLIKTSDGQQWTKAGWVKSPAAKTTQTQKTAITVPPELDSVTKIQAFQQWLDDYHGDDKEGQGKGWAKGYTGGVINKGQNGGGFGKFGPRTSAAWNNPTYKDAYMKSLQTTTTTPVAATTTTAPAASTTTTTTAPGPDDDVTQP